jgi:hypothetical protein
METKITICMKNVKYIENMCTQSCREEDYFCAVLSYCFGGYLQGDIMLGWN